MRLRKFTDLAGHDVWINADHIVMVRRPVRGLDSDTAGCVLDLASGETQAIQENMESALARLD